MEAEHAQKMPKAFRFDHSTVRRVKRFLAKENQTLQPRKEIDQSWPNANPPSLKEKKSGVSRTRIIYFLIDLS